MSPAEFTLYAFLISLVAGLAGALLGVGGGAIIVPGLTLLLGVPIEYAVAASIVGVVATSTGAAASFVRQGLTNIRLGMFLEMATVAGALAAAVIAGWVPAKLLYLVFSGLLAYSSCAMVLNRYLKPKGEAPPDAWADKLRLHGRYQDQQLGGHWFNYTVHKTKHGLVASLIAGMISGLLGVGGGILKVPTMYVSMRIPIKVTSATSNFMMGVTAAASAIVYFSRGQVVPAIVAPVAVGVLVGALGGSRLLPKVQSRWILNGFIGLLFYVAFEMARKGLSL